MSQGKQEKLKPPSICAQEAIFYTNPSRKFWAISAHGANEPFTFSALEVTMHYLCLNREQRRLSG